MYYYGKETFGFYGHAFALLKLPLGIIGQSFGQVFTNHCSELVHAGKSILPLLRKTILTLFLLSLIPFAVLFFFGEPIFAVVFGKEWAVSGQYAAIMAPWLLLNFVLSPVSAIMLLLNKQKVAFLIGVLSTGGQLFIFGVLPWFWESVHGNFSLLLGVSTAFLAGVHVLAGMVYFRFASESVGN
jgi:O-antigen/teichoic acid export membrane protein